MFTAITIDNRKISPSYKTIAFCGNCGSRLYPRCVTPETKYKKTPHFAHPKGVCCDDWYEPMSEWHYEWQSYVPIEQREVSIEHGIVKHIADILLTPPTPNVIIELQKSNIPFNIKCSRDKFYKTIIWVIHSNLQNTEWVRTSQTPIFTDLLNNQIKTPFGTTITKQQFIEDYLHNPNLNYDLLFPQQTKEEAIKKFTTQTKDNPSNDYSIIGFVMKDGSITIQCFCKEFLDYYKQMPRKYRSLPEITNIPKQNIIHDINNTYVICPHCKTGYSIYPTKWDSRGDDIATEIRNVITKNQPLFKSSMRKQWENYKTKKHMAGIK